MITTDISVLRKKVERVSIEEYADIILKLESALAESPMPGVGLAAPQIGINKSVAIIRFVEDDIVEKLDLVNPKILDVSDPYINKDESCLSFPELFVDTQRYGEVKIVDDLHPSGFVAVGFIATILQHEIDHLENILIIDRVIGKNKIRPNDLCPCGSKIKWKRCHGKC